MTEHTITAGATTDSTERRQHPKVRAVFDAALILIEPFFAPENQWGGRSLGQLAYHRVRESFPDLSVEEVHILVVAAERHYTARRTKT